MMAREKCIRYATYLSSSRAALEYELKSTDLIKRNQRSACLSSSVMLSEGVSPPFDGCSSLAISSDAKITLELSNHKTKNKKYTNRIYV